MSSKEKWPRSTCSSKNAKCKSESLLTTKKSCETSATVNSKEIRIDAKRAEKEAKEKLEEDEFTIAGKKSALIDERVRNDALKRKYEELFFKEPEKEIGPIAEPETEQNENANINISEKQVDNLAKIQRASAMSKGEQKSLKPEAKAKPKTSLKPGKNSRAAGASRSKSKRGKNKP